MVVSIKISGVAQAPMWETLQALIVEALNKEGRMTRIARPDGLCDYRAHGVYHVTFVPEVGDEVEVILEVLP